MSDEFLPQEQGSIAVNPIDMFIPITAPVSKLDADQYVAEDIDGVTENLFGSGNLNYLMLQSAQTNSALLTMEPFAITGENMSSSFSMNPAVDFSSASADLVQGVSFGHNLSDGFGSDLNTSDTPGSLADTLSGSSAGPENFSLPPLATGLISPAGLSGDVVRSSGLNGLNGDDGSGTVSQNGNNGQDGRSGVNGADGVNGDGQTTIIYEGDTLIDLGDVTNFLTTTIEEITELVENLSQFIDITEIFNSVNNVVNNIFNFLGGEGGLTLQLDAIISEVLDLDLDAILGDTVFNLIDQVIDLSPVTDVLDDIIDLDGLIVADLHSIVSLFGGENEHRPGDADLGIGLETVLGELDVADAIVDLAFDPIEDLVGDIDVLADVGLDLFQTGNIDNGAGDQDLVLGGDVELMGMDVLSGLGLDIGLDPLESVIGDVDINLGAGLDLLGSAADNIVDGFNGGSEDPNILSETGDLVTNIAGQALDAVLPQNTEAADDTDLTTGIDVGILDNVLPGLGAGLGPDVELDMAEAAIGDIDTDVSSNIDLFNTDNIDNASGDTDLEIGLDLGILGLDTPPVDLDIPLDPVEAILGDIDLDVTAALDLLGPESGLMNTDPSALVDNVIGLTESLLTDTGPGSLMDWTESVLPDAGNLFGSGLEGGLADILPDPVGDVTEGLGGLLALDSSSGGGLFGGGLFG